VGYLPSKPITTKQQSVFWLVSQSRHMSAIFVGSAGGYHLQRLVVTLCFVLYCCQCHQRLDCLGFSQGLERYSVRSGDFVQLPECFAFTKQIVLGAVLAS